MPDLERAVLEWSKERPYWQRVTLALLAGGEPINEERLEDLSDLAQSEASGDTVQGQTLSAQDFPTLESAVQGIRIAQISEPARVNALDPDQVLDFELAGITVVYGENGSGKSGWARILKGITRARHREEILSNVFEPRGDPPTARVRITFNGQERLLTWPADSVPELRQVSFYDASCGDRYLTSDTEVAYRPAALTMMDQLVAVCGHVRDVLSGREAELRRDRPTLPEFVAGSEQASFLEGMGGSTTAEQIDDACAVPDNPDGVIQELREREESLVAADPARERLRIEPLAAGLPELAAHAEALSGTFSDAVVADLEERLAAAANLRHAAELAARGQFDNEPIGGIGTRAWRELWEAARSFSTEEAYPGDEYPVLTTEGGPAHCVLCLQTLGEQAKARLARFVSFVGDTTARQAQEASVAVKNAVDAVARTQVRPQRISAVMGQLQLEDPDMHGQADAFLGAVEQRRSAIEAAAVGEHWAAVPSMASLDTSQLTQLRDRLAARLDDLDAPDKQETLRATREQRVDIEGRIILRGSRELLIAEVERRRRLETLEEAKRLTDTRGVTRRSAELTRSHISDVLKHHFSQETLRLGLERVMLADLGGEYGNLRHQAQLVGTRQPAELPAVLSEGEQTALGLAGFLTEVATDESKSAAIFDDPVSSLDHVRQERMAQRLVELAVDRQVIVFTHDISFVVDLKRYADKVNVPVGERWVWKQGTSSGKTRTGHPWDLKLVRQRLGELEERLAAARRVANGEPQEYEQLVRSWYQDLRLVWERMLEEIVVGPVLDRGKLEVRPKGFRVLVQITETDEAEFNAAFERCGEMGSHDRSGYLNRPAPSIEELEVDLANARTWHDRVRRYHG